MGAVLLFDIGGTKTRIGLSIDGKKIDKVEAISTPKIFEEGIRAINETVNKLASDLTIEKIYGGIAGMFTHDRKSLFYSPNLLGWIGKPISLELERTLGAPVYIENDAALAGLGEAVLGAGKGFSSVMYMTISTGVGGARIVDGKIDRNAYGFEPGQQIIDISHGACSDCVVPKNRIGGMGHLEDYISGNAVEQRFGKKAENFPQDDKLWDELADWLSVGLHNSILHWSPDAVVLGGGLILTEPAISLQKVETKLKEMLNFFPSIPIIKKAALGDEGGLHGALLLSQKN